MRSGLMRDWLVFEKPEKQRNETGELEATWTECFRCRAYRKKQAALSGDVQANEDFIGQTAVFLTWNYPVISYELRVRWDGRWWEIRLLEPRGTELTITLKRLDE